MKYYRVNIQHNPGSTLLIYPKNYEKEVGVFSIDHLYYDEKDQVKLILVIEDKNSSNILRENIEEITENEVRDLSEKYETRTEIITDEAKIRRLEIKARLGKKLTSDEEKSLDPNDETLGFSISKILADRLDDHKQKEKTA